jgi:hypothetical protein
MRKSYNKYRKEYRVKMYDPKWKIYTEEFIDKRTLEYAQSNNNNIQGFTYEPMPYKLYFIREVGWNLKSYFLCRFRIVKKIKVAIKFTKNETIKNIIISSVAGVIGTVIGYAILKYILCWI